MDVHVMGTMATYQLSRMGVLLTLCAACLGSHGPRGRPGAMLLESEQALNAEDQAALMELDTLLNLFQAKGKRSQDLAEKGLTRDLVTQVLQPGQAGMWFGPRLGRRRRRDVATPSSTTALVSGGRHKRSLQMSQDGDVDNDIPWKLAELLRELQGTKRSPTPCDSSDINCLLGSIYAPEQEQRSRSEGNLVNFTPRLGRESGEQPEDLEGSMPGGAGSASSSQRQLRTDSEPTWGFSPRLGRRLLPPGTVDVHAPAGVPPSPASLQPLLALERNRGGRSARSASTDKGAGSQGNAQ
ncbi:PBAN-type neuropeptide [Frankliniella fusca]|uniref:PBAN-type neuropeptide n=1 Tax=Frankliniella fusca TaxID=407009 RepID=A0AAE1GWL3_9NEOP|nr:PBAN-type neuropeptide [Frankliniella fusca]